MRSLLAAIVLCLGLAFGQLDLSTPGGSSVLATFVTDPLGAEVYVAGTFIGTGPATVRVNANTPTPYTVRVPGGEFEVYNSTVTLSQAGVTEVYVPRVVTPSPPSTPTQTRSTPGTATPSGTDSVDLFLRLAACADLDDSLERLTCYDRLATEYGLSGESLPTSPEVGAAAPQAGTETPAPQTPPRPTPPQDTSVGVSPVENPQQTQDLEPAALNASSTSLFDLARDGSYEDIYAALLVGAAVDGADAYGQTVLMYAARGNDDPNVHTTLVASGADIDARSLAGWTALMYAARDNPNPEVLLRLLELGADPSLVNDKGQTALELAVSNPDLQSSYALERLESFTTVAPPPPPVAAPPSSPAPFSPPPAPVSQGCCKYCRKGYACGNTCISRNKTCHVGVGCACNAGVGTDDSLIAEEEQFFIGLETDFKEPFVVGVCGQMTQLGFALP